MKRNDIRALHDKTVAELQTQLNDLAVQFAKAKHEATVGKLKDVKTTAKLSDDMARIKTVMRQKELTSNA